MKKITLRAGLLIAAAFFGTSLHAQEKAKKFGKQPQQFVVCGSTQNNEAQSAAQFEQWLAPKVAAIKNTANQRNGNTTNQVVTIPVVVHIVHNGDPVGVNENIAESQVLAQLEVLNQDYRRMANTPGYNNNPVGADMEIQFCLAKRTPDGQNTTGIIRHQMDVEDGWSMDDANETLKPATQWDPEQYLNIWVVDWVYIEYFGMKSELGGYAQFPDQSGLEGLEEQSPANQDGVVIGHRFFGSALIYPEGEYDQISGRNQGRSTTHEIGHFFGLRHIWGDGGCDVDDYCEDTPEAAEANSECIAGTDTCPDNEGLDMIENYMDYTPDACMNIFTQDQKARMQAVLQNSPRRVNLTTSAACSPAVVYTNDAEINILNLGLTPCSNSFSPEVKITNAGTTTLTSAVISYTVSGIAQQYNWAGSLGQDESATVVLPQMSVASGSHVFNIAATTVNGVADAYADNDTKANGFTVVPNATGTNVVTVNIQLDTYGSETVWGILDGNQEVVTYGGPYEDATGNATLGDLITEELTLESGECYTFFIYDIFSDGMCCEYGNGYYSVTDSNGNTLFQGGQFGQYETVAFGVNMTLDTPAVQAQNSITLYPNPANSVINIAVANQTALPNSYTIYNSLGQVVGTGKITGNNQPVSISHFASGVYIVKLEGATGSQALQFIKY